MEGMDLNTIMKAFYQKIDDLEQENGRLQALVQELRPYLEMDVNSGLSVGPSTESHFHYKDPSYTCSDCEWYNESIAWVKRLEAGELGV